MSTTGNIPSRFRAVMWDQMQFFVRRVADQQIRCVVSLDGRVDKNRMSKAVRLSLNAAPLLGCRYAESWWRPYWERLEQPDDSRLFTVLDTKDVENETFHFFARTIDPFGGPQVNVGLLRAHADTLCVNMNHMVGDAVGLKEYVYLTASMYRHLIEGSDSALELSVDGNRSLRQVSRHIGLLNKLSILGRGLRGQPDLDSWRFPLDGGEVCRPTFIIRRFSEGRYNAIQGYGKRHGATINDVVLTAYYRALARVIQPDPHTPLRIVQTVDLRRYIPSGKAGGICNLSSFVTSDIGHELGADFGDTLVRVRDDMNAKKEHWPGLDSLAPIVAPFKALPYSIVKKVVCHLLEGVSEPDGRRSSMPPTLTNMGIIDAEKLIFGDVGARDAYLTGAVNYPPGFQMGFSSFNKSLTFSVLTCDMGNNRQLVERLLEQLDAELPK